MGGHQLPTLTDFNTHQQMNQLCKVCGEPAAGFHFGAFTCEGCKSFFGRTYNNVSGVSECKNGGRCEITKKNRTSCKSCRLRKCLSVGMSKSGSRYGRRSNWFKIHCLLSAQNQNGMSSSPETNNNNSTVTNNNNNTNSGGNSNNHIHGMGGLGGKGMNSTFPPLSSLGGHSMSGGDNERSPSSSASRLNGAPPSFSSLVGLSPESREQFMSQLQRNMVNPELRDYFSRAGKNEPFYPEDGGEDMTRTGRSPGSLESPNSEASLDEKSNTPLFSLPPGSPLDVKPDFSPFDLITRDLMKLGYDPLRLWPAMLSNPPNLHPMNPYRFIFPNFQSSAAAAAAAFPIAFPSANPPPPLVIPSPGGNLSGPLHPAAVKMLSAASGENLTLPLASQQPHGNHSNTNTNTNTNSNTSSRHHHSSSPPTNHHVNVSRRFNSVVPPSSSLTLTPPISHHGSDDPGFLTQKFRHVPIQDTPIDLSASSAAVSARSTSNHSKSSSNNNNNNNNNNNGEDLIRVKGELISSDMEDEDQDQDEDHSDREINFEDEDMKDEDVKSEYGDSEEEEEEDLSILSRSRSRSTLHHTTSHRRRRSSCSPIPLPKRERVSTPLDLTRGTNNNNNSPPKIAT